MTDIPVVSLTTELSLESYVRKVLCEHDRLDEKQTVLFQEPISRNGRACGRLFHIRGPRMMRNSAIWTEGENRIMYYESTGKRFLEVRLSESPGTGA